MGILGVRNIPVTRGWRIKKGDRIKLDNDLPNRIFKAVEIGRYVVRLSFREGNSPNVIYSLHFKRSKYFKIQRRK